MELPEAARLLGVSEATLRRWVRQGLIVAHGPGGDRFERHELVSWARERGLTPHRETRAASAPEADLLADAVALGGVHHESGLTSASEAIARALERLERLSAEERELLLREVLDRERMASTAMGHGVALPHPRRPPGTIVTRPAVAVLFPEEPLDWAALDGRPVHTVMLLLSPSAPVHLELLSRVAYALRTPGFPAFLGERPDAGALVARLRQLKKQR